jgi:hypothetical protein
LEEFRLPGTLFYNFFRQFFIHVQDGSVSSSLAYFSDTSSAKARCPSNLISKIHQAFLDLEYAPATHNKSSAFNLHFSMTEERLRRLR